MKRLLVIHSAIAPYRVDFFNALSRAFDFKMVLFAGKIDSRPYDEQALFSGLEFTPVYMTERYGMSRIKFPKGYMRLMKEFHPDIILTLEFSPYAILPIIYKQLYNSRCKIYSIVDDSYYMLVNGDFHSQRHRIAEKLLLPFVDDIINLEPRVSDYFQQHYGKGICFPIMHQGEALRQKFEHALPVAQEYIDRYNLTNKKVILYVGRLIPLKNLPLVIESYKRLNNKDAALVFVGKGSQEKELKALAAGSDHIIFTGRLSGDALYAWYDVADVFILASTQECYGAVTNEALLAGCKAIVSRNAGSQCLVIEGDNGFIIDPYNPEEIISAMNKALKKVTTPNRPVKLKPNAMPFTFDSYIGGIIDSINK